MLVLDSTSAAGVETVQSLGSRGCTIHAVRLSQERTRRASRFVSREFDLGHLGTCDVGYLLDLCRAETYDLIVPATETSLTTLLSSDVPDDIYERAVLPTRQRVITALDKQAVWALAKTLGVRVPQSTLLSSTSLAPDRYPVVLKPTYSKKIAHGVVHDHYVTIVRNATEWTKAMTATYKDVTVQQQQYIPGFGVGVEMLFDHGTIRWTFVHKRIHELPLTGGGSSYRVSLDLQEDLIERATSLLSALEWHGVAMVEFKIAPWGDTFLMEVNPRLWGSLALAVDCGVDFPFGLFCVAIGKPLPPQPAYRVGYFTRNVVRDIEWFKANLRADHSDPLLRTRPVIPVLCEWLRPCIGRESWDFFCWRDLGVIITEVAVAVRHNLLKSITSCRSFILRKYLKYIQQPMVTRRLRRQPNVNVLFLCYGNICRSPLAAALAEKRFPSASVQSAGFHSEQGRQSPDFVIDAAVKFGINLADHRSRRVNEKMIDAAEIIFVMDLRNRDLLKKEFPKALEKTLLLGLMLETKQLEIQDPFDKSPTMGATAAELDGATSRLTGFLCGRTRDT